MKATAKDPSTISHHDEIFNAGLLAIMHMADKWNYEAAHFVRHRMTGYSELAAALGRCNVPPAAMLCWARFLGDTWADYAQAAAVTIQALARRAADETDLTSEAVAMPAKAPVLE